MRNICQEFDDKHKKKKKRMKKPVNSMKTGTHLQLKPV